MSNSNDCCSSVACERWAVDDAEFDAIGMWAVDDAEFDAIGMSNDCCR